MKILHYIYSLNIGGAESFIYNLLSSIADKNCKFDFCLQSRENKNGKLLKLIKSKNCKIFFITPFNFNIIKSSKEFENVLNNKEYDIVHIHMNAMINIFPLLICIKRNVKVIVHSHNTKSSIGILGNIIHMLNRRLINKYDFGRLACEVEAGKWMFGNGNFTVIKNAIIVKDYAYQNEKRRIISQRFLIPKRNFIIGHIGRFVYAKNHKFIVRVFKEFIKRCPDSTLILVGDGQLRFEIEQTVYNLNLEDNVIFTGNTDDITEYLSAFDALLFPSKFEGFPFALIEAQASGLKILTSDQVPKDLNISGLINYKSLHDSVNSWAESLEFILRKKYNRLAYTDLLIDTEYDSNIMAKNILKYYSDNLK